MHAHAPSPWYKQCVVQLHRDRTTSPIPLFFFYCKYMDPYSSSPSDSMWWRRSPSSSRKMATLPLARNRSRAGIVNWRDAWKHNSIVLDRNWRPSQQFGPVGDGRPVSTTTNRQQPAPARASEHLQRYLQNIDTDADQRISQITAELEHFLDALPHARSAYPIAFSEHPHAIWMGL